MRVLVLVTSTTVKGTDFPPVVGIRVFGGAEARRRAEKAKAEHLYYPKDGEERGATLVETEVEG